MNQDDIHDSAYLITYRSSKPHKVGNAFLREDTF
jgi:hypothetical protein